MRKPAGVIAAAVMMGLMALLGILLVSLSLVVFIFMHNPVNLPGFRVIVVLSNLLVLGFFLFCGWTVVGLFRMRGWARVSAIVIGSLVCVFSGVSGIAMLAVRNFVPLMPPPPPHADPQLTMLASLPLIVEAIAAFYFAVAVVGLWWVIYFILPKVRSAFAGAGVMVTNPGIVPPGGATIVPQEPGAAGSGWRVVIIVWACLMLLGIVSMPVVFLLHAPLFLFGVVLNGGAETAALVAMAGLQLVLGIGLLRKWRFAWYLGLAWQAYALAYTLAFLIPGVWGRFIAYQQDMAGRWSVPGSPQMAVAIDQGPFLPICFALGGVLVVVVTVALFMRKADYLDLESRPV
jgi:hypothetical protein